jgi:uncharacterized protein YabN with tetrapyrrole methylase and pyrophosphatase domain
MDTGGLWPQREQVPDDVRRVADYLVKAARQNISDENIDGLLRISWRVEGETHVDAMAVAIELARRNVALEVEARFPVLEQLTADRNLRLRDLSLPELDVLWEEADE